MGRKILNVNAIMNLAQAYWETDRVEDAIRLLKRETSSLRGMPVFYTHMTMPTINN